MNGADFQRDIGQMAQNVQELMRKLPALAGAEVLMTVDENFRSQSFFGDPWEPRKDGDTGRAILVKSGRLRRSFSLDVSRLQVIVRSDAPYAEIHNEGGLVDNVAAVPAHTRRRFSTEEVSAPGARKPRYVKSLIGKHQVQAHTRQLNHQMPQRQFLGDHPQLTERLNRLLQTQLIRIFRP